MYTNGIPVLFSQQASEIISGIGQLSPMIIPEGHVEYRQIYPLVSTGKKKSSIPVLFQW